MISKAPLAATIFGLTYLALAAGRVPGLRLDRASIALVGAAAMLACGAIDLREAAGAVDYETIVLLFGMMVLVAYLRMSGFFALATAWVAARCSGPFALLAAVIGLSGGLSAFLVNDVVCVALTPLVLEICRELRRPPIPYLIGLATASNVGSVATITGNPQNIIIGTLSGISYLRFAARLAPIAIAGLIINFLAVAFIYRRSIRAEAPTRSTGGIGPARRVVNRGLLLRSCLALIVVVSLFFVGAPIATVALVAAAALMLDRIRPEKVFRAVDWPLLIMFAGLFVVVHAFEANVARAWEMGRSLGSGASPIISVSILSAALSNLVSNVPAVLLFKPLMASIPDREQAWLALAASSTLAGNLTLLGSVANLIVVEGARRGGVRIGFAEYLKVGVPLTIITTALGICWLYFAEY